MTLIDTSSLNSDFDAADIGSVDHNASGALTPFSYTWISLENWTITALGSAGDFTSGPFGGSVSTVNFMSPNFSSGICPK